MSTLGERLREVREAMRLNQTAFAALAGASKRAQINYEQDLRAPDATYMAALAAAGLDVLYILTGQRAGAATPAPALSEGDRILLDNFHAAPAQVQAGIKTTLGAFAPGAGVKRAAARARGPGKPDPEHHTQQNFHAEVGQVAGRDIVNKKGRRP